jgi:hypothetical protein
MRILRPATQTCGARSPAAAGASPKLRVVRVPGKPPLIALQHERGCPWLKAAMATATGTAPMDDQAVARLIAGTAASDGREEA